MAIFAVLVPAALGAFPGLTRAWGVNLWAYLPAPAVLGLSVCACLLCVASVRERLARAAEAGWRATRRIPTPVALPLLALLLFLLRERRLYGDSRILLYASASGARFHFPDVGATWIFHLTHRCALALGADTQTLVQVLACLSGSIAIGCFARASNLLAPDPGRAAVVLALTLGGGVLRVFAGHVEVYALVLMCAGAFLWASLARLRGSCAAWVPALLLGVGLWMHLSFATLLPGLIALPWLAGRRGRSALFGETAAALALAAAPSVLFLAAMALSGGNELASLREKVLQITGREPDPEIVHYWLRPFWAEPGRGTDWILFSRPHLKYLGNSLYLLAPSALPVLLAFALRRRALFTDRPEARLLGWLCLGTVVYACLLRPIWGPYDWDLFSLTAVCLACLAAHLLVRGLDDARLRQVASVLIGATLLLVTLPFLGVGIAPSRAAGPFAHEGIRPSPQESAWDAFERQIEPWL